MGANQRFTLVAITVLLLGGCGGSETESTTDAATDAIGGLDSAMSSVSGDANSMSLDVVAKDFQKQLESLEAKLDEAKATAKSYDDGPLNKLISNLDSKIAEAHSLLGKLSKSSGQDELASLMKELPALYDEIKTKINVLGG